MARTEPRDETIQVRVTASEKEALKAMSESEGETMSNLLYPKVQELLRGDLPDFLTD